MTLRLIRDDERAVVPCEYGDGAATVLVIINETPGIPCCDPCARRFYNMRPDRVRLTSLDGYVDMFAAAKQAAFATPEQITGQPVQITASTALDDKVLRRIWADRVIYCRVRWCEESRRLTPASQRLNAIGGLWYPACQECINKFDPDQVETAPMSEENTAWELGMADEYARDHHWSKPVNPATWWAAGIAAVLGLVLCLAGAPDGTVSGSQPNGVLIAVGVLLILAGLGLGIAAAIRAINASYQKHPGYPATPPRGQQMGVPVNQLAGAAALGVGAYAVHEGLKHHREHVAAEQAATRERSAALRQNQQAMNDTYWQQQDNAAAGLGYKTNDQIGYGALVTHHNGPGPTRHSDIYGNLR
jgi:hypothetical protein